MYELSNIPNSNSNSNSNSDALHKVFADFFSAEAIEAAVQQANASPNSEDDTGLGRSFRGFRSGLPFFLQLFIFISLQTFNFLIILSRAFVRGLRASYTSLICFYKSVAKENRK
jgi:hypothetical protein